MASTIVITCPECKKQLKGPAELAGKKIRCKACSKIFTVKAGTPAAAAAPAKGAPAKAAPAKAVSAKAAKPAAAAPPPVREEDEKNPYKLTDVLEIARCPQCAEEMEEGAIICLRCGYNTQTRVRVQTVRTYEHTTADWIKWLAPGIACAVVTLAMAGAIVWIWLVLRSKYGEEWYGGFYSQIYGTVIACFIGWRTARFAIKRLIKNPRPPEIIRRV